MMPQIHLQSRLHSSYRRAPNILGAAAKPYGQRNSPPPQNKLRAAGSLDFIDISSVQSLGTPHLRGISHWTTHFLPRPHPLLGVSSRAVCPFAANSIAKNGIWVAEDLSTPDDARELQMTVTQMAEAFDKTPPTGKDSVYKALVVAFPQLNDKQGELLLLKIQQQNKAEFLGKGLMLGDDLQHQMRLSLDRTGVA